MGAAFVTVPPLHHVKASYSSFKGSFATNLKGPIEIEEGVWRTKKEKYPVCCQPLGESGDFEKCEESCDRDSRYSLPTSAEIAEDVKICPRKKIKPRPPYNPNRDVGSRFGEPDRYLTYWHTQDRAAKYQGFAYDMEIGKKFSIPNDSVWNLQQPIYHRDYPIKKAKPGGLEAYKKELAAK